MLWASCNWHCGKLCHLFLCHCFSVQPRSQNHTDNSFTIISVVALWNGHCKLLFWQPLVVSCSYFPEFCLHLTSHSCATSLHCLKQMRQKTSPQLREHVLLAKPVAVSVPQLCVSCHRAVAAASWPQKKAPGVHLCRQCPKKTFCWVLPLWTMWGSPILLVQDRLCPTSPPWGISNGCWLLRSGGKLYFSTWSAERREHLSHLKMRFSHL